MSSTRSRRLGKFRLLLVLLAALGLLLGCIYQPPSDAISSVSSTLQLDVGNSSVAVVNDYLDVGPRLVFSTVAGRATAEKYVNIRNTTASNIELTNISSSSSAFVPDPVSAKAVWLAPDTSHAIGVVYEPKALGVAQGTLSATVSGAPSFSVAMGAVNTPDFEGNHEASLQQVFDALGYRDNAGLPAKPPADIGVPKNDRDNSISDTPSPVGDEVLAHDFKRADPTKPVEMVPVASYVGRSQSPFGWFGIYNQGQAKETQRVLSLPGGTDPSGGQNQRLMPGYGDGGYSQLVAGSVTSFIPKFDEFGIWDGAHGVFTEDALNVHDRHSIRVFPAVRPDGSHIPNAYLVADDSGTATYANYDYQDAVLVVSNVVPVG